MTSNQIKRLSDCQVDSPAYNLNKAVGRNINRFPEDFMFRLNKEEQAKLMFHFGISSWGGTRKLLRVFTEPRC